jgi:hypothetical protein
MSTILLYSDSTKDPWKQWVQRFCLFYGELTLYFFVPCIGTANVPSSPILVTLMMEVLSSSETSVLTRATRRNIPEDRILHSHRREKPKYYVCNSSFVYFNFGFYYVTVNSRNSPLHIQPDYLSMIHIEENEMNINVHNV